MNSMEKEVSITKELDDLYPMAIEIVKESNNPLISHLQRRLMIGYNRAARLIEAMEYDGIVGPLKADGSRDIL